MFLRISGTSKVDWFGFCFVFNLTHMQSFVQLFLTLLRYRIWVTVPAIAYLCSLEYWTLH